MSNYYDNYRGRKKNNRHRGANVGCGGMLVRGLMRLLIFLLIIAILAVGLLYVLPVSFLNVGTEGIDLAVTKGLPAGYVNVLLLGLDMEKDGQQRCDCIMVASFGTNVLKITSLQRDTLVSIPGYEGKHKLNAAYSYGGAELTIKTVNQTFGLNITDYIAADFEAMVNLVDAVGGIDLPVTDNELYWYNKYAYRTWKSLCAINEAKYESYLTADDEVKQAGDQHMDGIHATGYCRIRYADSDYGRTNRQRKVLVAVLEKIKSRIYDPRMISKLYKVFTENIRTGLSIPALISLGEKSVAAVLTGNVLTNRVPQSEYVSDNGSSIEMTNVEAVKSGLYKFIYES